VWTINNRGGDPAYDAKRLAYNAMIREHYREFADGLADVAASAVGDSNAIYDLSLYQSDATHMNATGQAIAASVVANALQPFLN
jgi:hypothetical protein